MDVLKQETKLEGAFDRSPDLGLKDAFADLIRIRTFIACRIDCGDCKIVGGSHLKSGGDIAKCAGLDSSECSTVYTRSG